MEVSDFLLDCLSFSAEGAIFSSEVTSPSFQGSTSSSVRSVQDIVVRSPSSSVSEDFVSPSTSKGNPASSSHLNPDWLSSLKKHFREEIIDPCSQEVRRAVENNKSFDKSELKLKREVRMSIKSSLVKKLVGLFGGITRPSLTVIKELVGELKNIYPAMFRDEETSGWGLGGVNGNNAFAKQVKDAICKIDGLSSAARRKTLLLSGEEGEVIPSNKKKTVYGVSKFKYYVENVKDREAAAESSQWGQSFFRG